MRESSGDPGAATILVVDDVPQVRRLPAATLRREGFAVEEAVDGEAAPVVIVSAGAARATIGELLPAGADAFVSKRIVLGHLLDALARVLPR